MGDGPSLNEGNTSTRSQDTAFLFTRNCFSQKFFRKKPVRELLPGQPIDNIAIEPWWIVQAGYITEDDIKVKTSFLSPARRGRGILVAPEFCPASSFLVDEKTQKLLVNFF